MSYMLLHLHWGNHKTVSCKWSNTARYVENTQLPSRNITQHMWMFCIFIYKNVNRAIHTPGDSTGTAPESVSFYWQQNILVYIWQYDADILIKKIDIWVRSRNCVCLVTWFCYQLIAKPGNKTATLPWPDPYTYIYIYLIIWEHVKQKTRLLIQGEVHIINKICTRQADAAIFQGSQHLIIWWWWGPVYGDVNSSQSTR